MDFIETSALDAINIQPAFKDLVSEIYFKVYKIKEEQEEKSIFDNKKSVNLVVSTSSGKNPSNSKFECC